MKGDQQILLEPVDFQEVMAGHLRAILVPVISEDDPKLGEILRIGLVGHRNSEPYLLARITHVQPLRELPPGVAELIADAAEILRHESPGGADISAWLKDHSRLGFLKEPHGQERLVVCSIKGGLSW